MRQVCSFRRYGGVGRRQARGLVMVLAVFTLALVGLAVGLMASVFANEARRTQQQVAEAQLREILHAAPGAAAVLLDAPATGPVGVPLPAACGEGKLTLATKSVAADHRMVFADAMFRTFHASETLEYQRQGNAWKLQSVTVTSGGQMPRMTLAQR